MVTADRLLFVLKLLAALGCGLSAGVLFGFSSFVMSALGRLPPPQGIAGGCPGEARGSGGAGVK